MVIAPLPYFRHNYDKGPFVCIQIFLVKVERVRACQARIPSVTILARGGYMANLSGLVRQLKKERDVVQRQLAGLNAALAAFAGVYRGNIGTRPRRKMSARARARIAAAQRARWAKVKGQQKVVPIARSSKPGKRTVSASVRRKIAAAQRARWAKVKRDKKAA
jgi:hypothetical protein